MTSFSPSTVTVGVGAVESSDDDLQLGVSLTNEDPEQIRENKELVRRLRERRKQLAEDAKAHPVSDKEFAAAVKKFDAKARFGINTIVDMTSISRQLTGLALLDGQRMSKLMMPYRADLNRSIMSAVGASAAFDVNKVLVTSLGSKFPRGAIEELRNSVAGIAQINYATDVHKQLITAAIPNLVDRTSVLKVMAGIGPQPSDKIKSLMDSVMATGAFKTDFETLTSGWLKSYKRYFDVFAETAAFFARLRESVQHGALEFVYRYGWAVPLAVPALVVEELVELDGRPKSEVRAAVMKRFAARTRAYCDCRDRLLDGGAFVDRRRPIEQALKSMRAGDNYSAICTMLPLVEGAMVDAVFDEGETPEYGAVKRARSKLKDAFEDDVGRKWAIETIETLAFASTSGVALYDRFDPDTYGRMGEPRSLNRHAILHGAARRYGTAENSLKLFLLLVALAELLDMYGDAVASDADTDIP